MVLSTKLPTNNTVTHSVQGHSRSLFKRDFNKHICVIEPQWVGQKFGIGKQLYCYLQGQSDRLKLKEKSCRVRHFVSSRHIFILHELIEKNILLPCFYLILDSLLSKPNLKLENIVYPFKIHAA